MPVYFDPETGESFNFGPTQTPPPGWQLLQPVPSPTPLLPPGTDVFWLPGQEPHTYVDPATGQVKWVYSGEQPPTGWKPLTQLFAPPPLTKDSRAYFDPSTGEWYTFAPTQTPPAGWEKLQPIPSPAPHLPPGADVFWLPGQQPQPYVDPATGEVRWVYSGEQPPTGWKPLTRRYVAPPLTKDARTYFDPASGQARQLGSNETAPDGWKMLQPIPSSTPLLPIGTDVTWLPGQEPRLYVDPASGEVKWIYSGQQAPAGWKPLTLPNDVPLSEEPAPSEGEIYIPPTIDPGTSLYGRRLPAGSASVDDFLRPVGGIAAPLEPIVEWSIWNPGYRLTLRQKGYINYIRGSVLEWLAGNNLGRTFPAADYIREGAVGQIKSIYSTNVKYIKYKVVRKAAQKLVKFIHANPKLLGGSAAELQIIVPTGTAEEVIDAIGGAQVGMKGKTVPVKIIEGLPGAIGKGLKAVSFVGGVVSTYEFVRDVQKGDTASAIGSGAGTATFGLELGASALGSTTLAAGGALTGSFALGYAIGTEINNHALSEDTKNLIGETLVEFIDHGWTDFKDYYFGRPSPPPTAKQIMSQEGIATGR